MKRMLLRRAHLSRASRVVCPTGSIVLVVSLSAAASTAVAAAAAAAGRRRRRRRAGSVSLRERTEERARTRRAGEENRGTRSVVSRTPHRHHPTLRDNPARARPGRDPPVTIACVVRVARLPDTASREREIVWLSYPPPKLMKKIGSRRRSISPMSSKYFPSIFKDVCRST